MARVNVYLPDDLAAAAREAGLNVSGLTQHAIRGALARSELDVWLTSLDDFATPDVSAPPAAAAVNSAREEFGVPGEFALPVDEA